MESRHDPRFIMVLSAYNMLLLRRKSFSGIPSFNDSMEKLDRRLKLISRLYKNDCPPVSLRKDRMLTESKRKLIESLLKISRAICLYSSENEMHQLFSSMDLSQDEMTKLRNSILAGTALRALDFAQSSPLRLRPYGIDQNDIRELESCIASFKEKLKANIPESESYSIGALREIKKLLDEVDFILEKELGQFTLTVKQRIPIPYTGYMTPQKYSGMNIS